MLSNDLNPKTFDLVGMLSGRDYPTLDLEVYFNEALGFSINKMRDMLRSLEILDKKDEAKKVSEELEGLVKKASEQKFVISLKGIPEKVFRSAREKHLEEHPEKLTPLGLPEQDRKSDEAFMLVMWRLYVTSVTDPEGAEIPTSEEEIKALHDYAPVTVHNQISTAIKNLREDSVKGFEYAAKEVDFLSHASPEG